MSHFSFYGGVHNEIGDNGRPTGRRVSKPGHAYAVIDADGRYGSHATVWAVYDLREEALARAKRDPSVQVIEIAEGGKDVGDKIHPTSIGTIYPRVR